jgi:hypothetical protein
MAKEPPISDAVLSRSAKQLISRARALLVKLIDAYAKLDYALTKIEIQKLAYFLQVTARISSYAT